MTTSCAPTMAQNKPKAVYLVSLACAVATIAFATVIIFMRRGTGKNRVETHIIISGHTLAFHINFAFRCKN